MQLHREASPTWFVQVMRAHVCCMCVCARGRQGTCLKGQAELH